MLLPLPKSSLHLMCNDFKNIMQIIEEDITKFNVRSHFLPFLEEKSHHTRKYAKVIIYVQNRCFFIEVCT